MSHSPKDSKLRYNTRSSTQNSQTPQQPQTRQNAASSSSTFSLIQTSTSLSAIPSSTPDILTLLVHSTNAFGTWGAGFAKALRNRYPNAETVYKSWCDETRPSSEEWPSSELVGRCLVLEAQIEDQSKGKGENGDGNEHGDGDDDDVAIACLFTSYGYGGRAVKEKKSNGGGHAAKDGVTKVVESTRTALVELRRWIDEKENEMQGKETRKGEQKRKVIVYSPKFNSGNFGVDWEVTANMIREVFEDWEGEWRILGER